MSEVLCAKVAVFVDLYKQIQTIRRHEKSLEITVAERTEALKAEISERKQAETKASPARSKRWPTLFLLPIQKGHRIRQSGIRTDHRFSSGGGRR
ncbi:hypothetical protein [Pseudomonas sp. Q2-TVG4-2]|uniref:hypothetical protein n=1 Tax=Pseudomonas sp. Q2-TVG4-2 TaxID=1685699 RepID=UPI0015E6FC1A|nr:hypothetical protein [Pseudomonas sp. Q2-TVG4-2]